MVLAFGLGMVATVVRSDLRFPEELYTALSIYLLLAIGLKGGAALAETPLAQVWKPVAATVLLGVAGPFGTYAVLRRLGGFGVADAAAIAAHYGSVSVVTFTASLALLEALQVAAEGFLPALVAVMEVPGIVVAMAIARARGRGGERWPEMLREVLAGRSVLLLLGGLAIGWSVGPRGLAQVAPLFVEPFMGVLMLFLLEMGMVAARRMHDLRRVGGFLLAFGIATPVVQGAIGVWLGALAGLSLGGATVLGTMAASASYIAAPAAVRLGLPEANPSYYLTLALAITFPFNLTLGIPFYHLLARLLLDGA